MTAKSLSIKIGDRFGKWIVTGNLVREKRGQNYLVLYPCKCGCGTERDVRAFKLLSNSRSCGCEKIRQFKQRNTKHGYNKKDKRNRLYRIWDGMLQRCTNENHESYHLYGGKGVKVCKAWRDFNRFREWAESSGYSKELQIDRINSNKGYFPGNCRWVTTKEQSRNKSNNRWLTVFGETKCFTDWALDPRCRVSPSTLRHRIDVQGMKPREAITQPSKTKNHAARYKGNHVK